MSLFGRHLWPRFGARASARPASVVVQLLRDGAVWDEATLCAANGWSQAWEGLGAEHWWAVVEKDVPEGYAVSVDREGAVLLAAGRLLRARGGR